MKLNIKIDAPEEGDPPSQLPPDAIGKLASVFEKELPLLCRQLDNYAEVEVSVSFLDRAEMAALNKEHRGFDEPTDVLTFPLWEEEGRFSPPSAFGMFPLALGDVVICPEEVERERAGTARTEALCLVLAHGFLHLLGRDHDTPDKEEAMREHQEFLKSKLLSEIGEVC
jgi:probable rRNA maturation factor